MGFKDTAELTNDHCEDSWLTVAVVVTTDRTSHTSELSWELREAAELGVWLQDVARATANTSLKPNPFWTVEPEFAAEVIAMTGTRVTTRWYVYDETAPVLRLPQGRVNASAIEVRATPGQLRQWASDLLATVPIV